MKIPGIAIGNEEARPLLAPVLDAGGGRHFWSRSTREIGNPESTTDLTRPPGIRGGGGKLTMALSPARRYSLVPATVPRRFSLKCGMAKPSPPWT